MICGYLLLNASTLGPYVRHTWASYPALRIVRYLLLFALSGVGFGVVLMSLNRLLLIPVCLLLVTIVTTNGLAKEMLDLKVLGAESAEWLLSETGEAPNAIRAFPGPLGHSLMIALALLVPSVWIARLARQRFRARLRPVLWGSCALFVYALGDAAAYHYDRPYFPVESNLLVYDAALALKPDPDIPPIDMRPVRQPEVTKIVLLVDESVPYRAYVDELRGRWARWNGADYGEAASLANCSAAANSMLRWGLRAQRMLAGEDPRLAPTIWSYAREAGFETWLIDGQRGGSYQNYMRGKEAALIDHFTGVDAGMETDGSIAELLHNLLLQPARRFIYVNKSGAHFPYKSKYPADHFPGARTLQQQHAAALRYSTEDFLDKALRGVPLQDAIIIYTSDHGEQFSGQGAPHCNPKPVWQEYSVPLLLISGEQSLAKQAAAAADLLRDHVTHAQIFSTLLGVMGYDGPAAEAEYGPSLLSGNAPAPYFHVRPFPFPGAKRDRLVVGSSSFPYREPRTASAAQELR